MKRPQIIYLDNNAWQELSKETAYVEALDRLHDSGDLRFALSSTNLNELPLGLGPHHVRIRRRIASAIIRLGLTDYLFRTLEWIERAEFLAAGDGLDRIGPFFPSGNDAYIRARAFLQECLEEGTPKQGTFDGLQEETDEWGKEWGAIRHDAVESMKRKAASMGVNLRQLSEEEVFEEVRQDYGDRCRTRLLTYPEGQSLLDAMDVSRVAEKLHVARLIAKAVMLLAIRQAQGILKMRGGDLCDIHHLPCAWYADLFITEDKPLMRLARDMHEHLDEPGMRCVSLGEFLSSFGLGKSAN